ncbi:MAG: PAS domain S-box protein [Ignavibacteria bacterium]
MNERNQKTILLVDDEVIIAISGEKTLVKFGYNVITVNSGEKAIEICRGNNSIDLILMDIDMGDGMDGTETAIAILKEREIPIVFLSSHTEPEIVEKTEKITSYGYVVKNSGDTVLDASIKMAFKLFDAHEKIENELDERKRAEEARQKSEEKYRLLVENSYDIIYTLSLGGELIFASPSWTDILGHPVTQVTGQSFKQYIHPDDISVFQAWLDKVITTGYRQEGVEYRIQHKNGTWRWHTSGAVPLKDENGTVTGYEGIARDITKRKVTDKNLSENEEQFKNMVHGMSVGVILQGPTAEIIISNPKALELLGLTEDQLLGKSSFDPDWNVIHEDGTPFPGTTHPVPQAIATRQSVRNVIMGVYRPTTKSRIWILVDAEPQFNSDGTVKWVICTFIDTTELKLVEAKFHEANEYLNNLFDYANAPIITWDPEFRITRSNHAFERLTGRLQEEVIGMMPDILFPDDTREASMILIQKALEGEHWETVEIPILTKDAGIRTVIWNSANVADPGDKIISTIAQGIDITTRKRAGKALRESESRYKMLANNSSDVIWTMDLAGKFTYISPSVERLRGFTVEEIMNQSFEEVISPGSQEIVKEKMARRIASASGVAEMPTDITEVEQPCKGGSTVWTEVASNLLYDETGKAIGILGVSRDISKRKIFQDALIESENKFRALITQMQLGLAVHEIICDETGTPVDYKFLDTNPSFEKLTGLKREDIIGKTVLEIMPNTEPEWIEKYGHVALTGEPLHYENYAGELNRYYGVVAYRPRDKEFAVIIEDITERRHAEEKIKKLLVEKEIILKEVHHRIKNNMSTITGVLALQAEHLEDPSAIRALADAESRVRSMMILYDKLYLSVDFQKMPVIDYLPSLTDKIIENFPNKTSIKIEKKIDDFVLDTKRLQPLGIIINELLTNIMKYAFTGRNEGLITLFASLEGEIVSIIIQDNGNGMPDSINFKNSTGFGLTLVGILAEQLGGTVRIDRGNGTKVILEFKI